MEKVVPTADRLSARTKWTYSLGGIGRDMAYALYSTYLLTFILFTKGVDDKQFAAISVILIVCRIWDAVNDPVMGGIIEMTRTKWGKFKPWILIGVVTNAIVLTLVFTLPIKGWTFVIAFVVMYLLWDITFTMNDIAYWSMLPSLTSNPKDRATLTSMANLFAAIGGIIAVGAIPLLTAGESTIGGNAVTAYAVIAVVISVIFIGCQVMTVIGVQEKPLALQTQEKMGIKRMVKVLFNNDQLLWIALVMLLYNLGSSLILGFGSTYVYFEFGYNGFLVTVFVAVYAVTNVGVAIVYPQLEAKFARKTLQTAGIVAAVFGYLLFFITGILWKMNFATLCIGLAFIGAGQELYYMVQTIAIANTVEYNEWKTGSRDEGLIFSVRPFMAKLGSSLQQLAIMVVFLAVGVTGITQTISDAENNAARGLISEAERLDIINAALDSSTYNMRLALRAAMVFLPIILLLVSYFIFRAKYKIDEDFYNKMLKEIAEKKESSSEKDFIESTWK